MWCGDCHQGGIGEGDDDVVVKLAGVGALRGPHGSGVAGQGGHCHFGDCQPRAQNPQG